MSQKSVSGWFKTLSFKKAKKDKGEEKETGKETDKDTSKQVVDAKIANEMLKQALVSKVSEITKGATNDDEVFQNILEYCGKTNDDSACSCGSGQGICCMDCNH